MICYLASGNLGDLVNALYDIRIWQLKCHQNLYCRLKSGQLIGDISADDPYRWHPMLEITNYIKTCMTTVGGSYLKFAYNIIQFYVHAKFDTVINVKAGGTPYRISAIPDGMIKQLFSMLDYEKYIRVHVSNQLS